MLTEDPSCRIIGQMYESGWQHDCLDPARQFRRSDPGAQVRRSAGEPWPRVLGITVSLILLDGMDPDEAEAAMLSADDPSYFTLLSTAVPVSAFINKVAQYLPPDPEVAAYIAKHSLDTGYSRGDDIDYDALDRRSRPGGEGEAAGCGAPPAPRPVAGRRRQHRCGDRRLHDRR